MVCVCIVLFSLYIKEIISVSVFIGRTPVDGQFTVLVAEFSSAAL